MALALSLPTRPIALMLVVEFLTITFGDVIAARIFLQRTRQRL
jgi:hypothetical protein